jgi:CubicO group peptidase (beta-lactamase class C family)
MTTLLISLVLSLASPPDRDAEIVAALTAYLRDLVAADQFSGAVLVARDDRPIFLEAYGLASQSFQARNRVDTKFNLGSMNKMITAIAIAQLAEQGELSLGDTVGMHIPDYPNKEVASRVMIDQLLTHTSGMGTYFTDAYVAASKLRFKAVEDYLPLFVDQPLAFPPGDRFAYSNAGFMLLGYVIEKVTSQTYFDYVRKHIYEPAGMKNTDCYELDRDTPNLAIGYTREGEDGRPAPGPRKNNLFLHVVKGGPAGGGFSTVEDLFKLAQALRSHKLLSKEATDDLWTGRVAAGRGDAKYGLGFFVETVRNHKIVGHGGGFSGINGKLDIYLDLPYTVAVLSNYDPPAAEQVSGKLRELILANG